MRCGTAREAHRTLRMPNRRHERDERFGGSFEAEHKRDALQKRIGELEAELELVKVACGVKGTTLGSLWASHTERAAASATFGMDRCVIGLVRSRKAAMVSAHCGIRSGSPGL